MPKKRKTKFQPKFCKKRQQKFDSDLEIQFYDMFLEQGLPKPITQYEFHPEIRWRFDFCWPDKKLAVEVQGYGQGHTSYLSMLKDYRKHNYAVSKGWTMLYFMSEHLSPSSLHHTIRLLEEMLDVGTTRQRKSHPINPVIERRRIEAENFNLRQHRRDL